MMNGIVKVFESNFTTKSESKGTGLGLYMSKIIIEDNMDGKILAKNINELNGVEFKIYIPNSQKGV